MINISTDETEQFVVETEPKLVSQDHYTIRYGSTVLGTVEATFDLSNVPEEFHQLILSTIQGERRGIQISEGVMSDIAKKSWFRRFLGG